MSRSALKFVVICIAMAAASCGQGSASLDPAKPATESKNDSATLGVSASPPPSWYSMNNDQKTKLMDVGIDVATAGNDQLKAVAEASKKSARTLFMYFKNPPGAPVEFNPAVLAIAENVSLMPGIRTGRDYFFHVKRALAQSALTTEVVDDGQTRKIDGRDFDQIILRMTVNGIHIEQLCSAARHGDYVVMITQVYHNDEERGETSAVVDSIKLDW